MKPKSRKFTNKVRSCSLDPSGFLCGGGEMRLFSYSASGHPAGNQVQKIFACGGTTFVGASSHHSGAESRSRLRSLGHWRKGLTKPAGRLTGPPPRRRGRVWRRATPAWPVLVPGGKVFFPPGPPLSLLCSGGKKRRIPEYSNNRIAEYPAAACRARSILGPATPDG